MVGDKKDARFYLSHSFHLLGLHKRLALLLSLLINDCRAPTTNNILSKDSDIRQLLVILALISEPNNINVYFDSDGEGFDERYRVYLHEVQRISKLQRINKSDSAARNSLATTASVTRESI